LGLILSLSIVHTADWQLGKPFGSIEGDAAAVLREQRYDTIRRIGEEATKRSAAAVLVAGDVFDSVTTPDQVIRRALETMKSFSGPWVLLPGNHDPLRAESPWTHLKTIGHPENVIPAVTPAPIIIADGNLAVLPAPLTRKHEPDDVTRWMDNAETPPGAFRVGLAHGSVTNRLPEPDGDVVNQIADDRAETAKLDYLALGDWHGTVEIAPRTWYSGTPEPDRFPRNDPGNILVVTLESEKAPQVEKVAVSRFHWHRLEIALGAGGDVDATAAVEEEIAAEVNEAEIALLHLRLSGTVDLATRLRIETLLDEWQARLRYLYRDLSGLVDEPSDDDLDLIDHGGFVRAAVDRLKTLAEDPAVSERDAARTALRILYFEHVAGGS